MDINENKKGDIVLKTPNVIEWNIPDFFLCPEDEFYYMYSPPFPYLDATWCLACYPNGTPVSKRLVIGLLRAHCQFDHTLAYRVGIRTEDGLEVSRSGKTTFDYVRYMCWEELPLSRATLLEHFEREEDVVTRDRKVTIFCIFPAAPETEGASYTKETEGKDASTKAMEKDIINEDENTVHSQQPDGINGILQLSQSFQNIFLSGDHHDTTIKVKDQEFRAHKLVLIVRSCVFESMFRHDTIERKTSEITVEDCDPDAFREFLFFLYSGKFENLSEDIVTDLYYIGDKYQVDEVKSMCVKFMLSHLSVDNFCDYITLALRHSERELLHRATDYFVKNAKKIIVTARWISFHKAYPIESNELHIKVLMHLDPE